MEAASAGCWCGHRAARARRCYWLGRPRRRKQRPSAHQTGGRVFLFLHTDDFQSDYERMRERGVSFEETPREETYGTVAVFTDLYGNRWDLLQLHDATR